MNEDEIAQLPEVLTPSQAQRLLHVGKDALGKVRKACPEVALRLPGMTHWRYSKSKLLSVARRGAAPVPH